MLRVLSKYDYRLVQANRFPQENTLHYLEIKRLGIEEIFKDEFERIRRSLPQEVQFPEDKLFYATPLFDFGQGFVPAEIGDGFIRERIK